MRIYLPHINYTVHVKPRKDWQDDSDLPAMTYRRNRNTSVVYIDTPSKLSHMGLLAHEMTHVLQNICRDRHMDFTYECEHMGYIMQLLIGKTLGLEYEKR